MSNTYVFVVKEVVDALINHTHSIICNDKELYVEASSDKINGIVIRELNSSNQDIYKFNLVLELFGGTSLKVINITDKNLMEVSSSSTFSNGKLTITLYDNKKDPNKFYLCFKTDSLLRASLRLTDSKLNWAALINEVDVGMNCRLLRDEVNRFRVEIKVKVDRDMIDMHFHIYFNIFENGTFTVMLSDYDNVLYGADGRTFPFELIDSKVNHLYLSVNKKEN